ncbi:MAG: hypothetical protein KAS32_04120, partial [Candidatus Peribacteraceae bacterium]|nr:hypothetical protein [Candidatus Peribacteraceae bacterium]
MQHKIKSSLLEKSWFESAIFDILDKHEEGDDIYNSSLAVFLKNHKVWGGLHRSMIGKDLDVAIKDRIDNFIKLYLEIKKNGYKDLEPFFVWFDNDGFIHLYDGHHRLGIIRYLKLNPLISISTEWTSKGIDPDGVEGRDFPIKELASSIWKKNRLYHHVNDPLNRFAGWTVQRPDTETRRDYILKNLKPFSGPENTSTGPRKTATVVDIGCSEGYLSRELAKEGYDVTGIEKGYLLNK